MPDDLKPVAEIAIEDDYWQRGHFMTGRDKVIKQITSVKELPVGTKLYVRPTSAPAGEYEALAKRLLDQVENEDECCAFGGDGFGGGNIFREATAAIRALEAENAKMRDKITYLEGKGDGYKHVIERLRKAAKSAASFIGDCKHTKRGEVVYENLTAALGGNHD